MRVLSYQVVADPGVIPALPTYHFEPTLYGVLSLIVTVALPVLAALVMRPSWAGWVRGLVLLAAAAVKAFAEAWLFAIDGGTPFDAGGAAYTVVIDYVIAVAFYFGLWKGSPPQQGALKNLGLTDQPAKPGRGGLTLL
jgi:hypothetical protein